MEKEKVVELFGAIEHLAFAVSSQLRFPEGKLQKNSADAGEDGSATSHYARFCVLHALDVIRKSKPDVLRDFPPDSVWFNSLVNHLVSSCPKGMTQGMLPFFLWVVFCTDQSANFTLVQIFYK